MCVGRTVETTAAHGFALGRDEGALGGMQDTRSRSGWKTLHSFSFNPGRSLGSTDSEDSEDSEECEEEDPGGGDGDGDAAHLSNGCDEQTEVEGTLGGQGSVEHLGVVQVDGLRGKSLLGDPFAARPECVMVQVCLCRVSGHWLPGEGWEERGFV